jgi:mannitol/fructose-specific phosphotransferase system IIA component (Ntr-type)
MPTDDTTRFLISSLITPPSIQLHLVSRQRDQILEELVGCIPEIAHVPEARARLLKALQEREQLHSTGVGDGVALPHARNALVGLVERPVIAFGRHAEGVPFGAIDGRPSHLFFLMVSTTVTQHLQILARVSRLVRDPRLRQGLLAAEQPARVIALIREAEEKL